MSWLITTRNAPENCKIDWDSMNTDLLFNQWVLRHCYEKPVSERPKTLLDVANLWNDTKFCGYFGDEQVKSLQEFCRCLKSYGSHPRLYYEYEGFDQVHCLEFIPGTSILHYGVFDFSEDMEKIVRMNLKEDNKEYADENKAFLEAYYNLFHGFRNEYMETLPEKEGWKWEPFQVASEVDLEKAKKIFDLLCQKTT